MSRYLSLVLCLVCAPASAIEVSEGDYYDRLVAPARLDMTGGEIGELIMGGSGNDEDWPWTFNISGGVIGEHIPANRDIQLRGGYLTVSGGTIMDDVVITAPGTHLAFHGWYFEHYNAGRPNYNVHIIRGWLADGSWINFASVNDYENKSDIWPINFVIEPHDGLTGDVNGDWLVDIADLNFVRNGFGSEFDIDDLNDVRNNFGKGGPFFPAGTEGVEVHSQASIATPEPSSIILVALAIGGCGLWGWRKRQDG